MPSSRDIGRRVVPRPVRRRAWQLRNGLERLEQQAFERRFAASTSGHEYLEDHGHDTAERGFYEGCQYLPVVRALRSLPHGPDTVFADLGSGKGQALLIAGTLPYRKVIGVELVDDLTQAAQRNLAAARPKLRAAELEAVTADVLEWPVPDDLSVVFMYCPFMGDLFKRVMARLFDSYDRQPRELHLVYDFPWMHDWLMGTGRVRVADVRPAQWPATPFWWRTSWVITTYRVVGPGEGGAGRPALPRRFLRPRRAVERWSRPNGHVFMLTRDGQVVARSDEEHVDPGLAA
jgi:SAM-dependent methyltransferase